MSLDMREFQKYVNDFKSMQADFDNFLKNFITKQAYEIVNSAIKLTHRVTGKMNNSWVVKNYKKTANTISIEIKNAAEYSAEVEYGHRGIFVPALGVTLFVDTKVTQGQFMTEKSIMKIMNNINNEFDKAFTEFLKQKGLL